MKIKPAIAGLKEILLPHRARRGLADSEQRLARALFRPPESAGRPLDLVHFLRQVTLFEDLDRWELRRLARIVHEREYHDGEYICTEGTPGAALFVLRSGTADVLSRGRDGNEVPLALIEPPASFEEAAATGTAAAHRYSVRARGPVSLLALGKSDLDAMIVNFPVLANKVLIKLAGLMAMRLHLLLQEQEVPEPDPNAKPAR